MDLFALGTPVIDLFAKVDGKTIASLGITKGATNFFSAKKLAAVEKKLGRKITYRYAGDNARNVCEGVAALGGFAGFAGAVGTDKAGAYFAANLEECGIADFLQEKKGSTGKILALITPDGERTFCADLGVSSECDLLDMIALVNAKTFFVSSITLVIPGSVSRLAAKYMERCRKMKRKIALSLESPPMVENNRNYLLFVVKKYADALFLNEEEAGALLGKKFESKLAKLKPETPIYLKKGKNGSVLFLRGRRHEIPAMKAKAVDTTGAGDAYAAGTLYGLSRGYTPLGSGKIGCMLATYVVENFGAGIPLGHTRIKLRHNFIRSGRKNSAPRIRLKHKIRK